MLKLNCVLSVAGLFLLAQVASAVPGDAKDAKEKGPEAKPAVVKPAPEAPPAPPPPPTTQQVLHPDYPPAFAEAAKAMESFKLAPGLKVDVFAAEPQLQNPVALSIDDKGKFWVVETFRFDGGGEGNGVYDIRHRYHLLDDDLGSLTVEQRLAVIKKWNNNDLSSLAKWPDRLKLIEDRNGDGKADFSSVFAEWKEPLDGVASGVITRPRADGGEDVYVANIPNLMLLRDENHDGVADSQQVLSTGYGVRYSLLGHDLHGLRWGPDGKLYFSNGDRGQHIVTKEGKTINLPDEGAVLRCDPDGSNLEVFATGLRNPQKLAFDQYGNLFTGDNNCDYGDSARWVYLVEGGDTGWRIGYQHIQTPRPTGPWLAENLWHLRDSNTGGYLLPPIAHIASGPSGCTYYPGTGLTDKYKEHFFLTDFRGGPSSVVHSFALKPMGASFELVDRGTLVQGIIPTDVEFGPDGGAYVTDWIAGFSKIQKGRIFRIFSPEADKSPIVIETKKLLNEGMSKRDSTELAKLLAHIDMRVRQAAQFELATRGDKSVAILTETAQKSDNQLARIHAIWGLGQLGRKSPQVLQPLIALLGDKDDEIRVQAAKILGDGHVAAAYEPMVVLLADDAKPRVQYFAALNLGKLGRTEAIEPILAMLTRNNNKDVFLRHGGVMGLTLIGDKSALIAAAKSESSAARMGVLLAMRRLQMPEIAMFLQDKDVLIVVEAARAINDVPIEPARAALAGMLLKPRPATQPTTAPAELWPETVVHRALNANFRLGAAENAQAVAAFAAKADSTEVMRIEALATLKEWETPRGIDRVVGVWRPVPPRDPAIATNAVRPVLKSIITTAPDGVRIAAIDLLKKVGSDDTNLLFAVVTNKDTSPDVGAAALSAMDALKDPRLGEAVDASLTQGKGALRTRSIEFLSRRPDAVTRLSTLLADGSIPDQQAVLTTLGKIESPASDQILSTWMDKLAAGAVAPALQLDLLEAAGESKSDAVRQKVKQYEEKRPKDDVVATFDESLVGGDAGMGKKIFYERQDVSCLRCHKIAGEGGVAGPDLSSLALRKDRHYMLESIVNPNKEIAPGFEAVTVKVKAGKNYVGVVRADTDAEVVIDAGDGATIHIIKPEIASRTKGLSPMPQDVSKTLSKRDVRNLVEFLSTLKAPVTQPATQTAGTR